MSFRPPYAPRPRIDNQLAVACLLAGLILVLVLVVRLLLPWLVVAGLVVAGFWCWRRQRAQQRGLHLLFYEQLAARQGRISVLEFAIAAQLTGTEARAFLDARAKEFFANFEPTDAGDVLYTFHTSTVQTSGMSSSAVTPGPAAPVPKPPPYGADAGEDQALRLTAAELALRLGCPEYELTDRRHQPNFRHWSREQDPDSCGWTYDPGCDRYRPIRQNP